MPPLSPRTWPAAARSARRSGRTAARWPRPRTGHGGSRAGGVPAAAAGRCERRRRRGHRRAAWSPPSWAWSPNPVAACGSSRSSPRTSPPRSRPTGTGGDRRRACRSDGLPPPAPLPGGGGKTRGVRSAVWWPRFRKAARLQKGIGRHYACWAAGSIPGPAVPRGVEGDVDMYSKAKIAGHPIHPMLIAHPSPDTRARWRGWRSPSADTTGAPYRVNPS